MTGKRVLLFGATGFIGRHAADAMARDDRAGEIVRVGRSRGDPGWERHDLVHDGAKALAELLDRVRPDVVVNCTGRLDGSFSELVESKTLVTSRLLHAVAGVVPQARLVLLGSAAEYGPVPAGRAVTEEDDVNPVSAYGFTSLASTLLARHAAVDGRVDAVVLRVFNPIGPGLPESTLLGRTAANIRDAQTRGDTTIRLGPLDAYRDFVDVRDVATAIGAAAFADDVKEPVLNVGSGRAVAIRDAVRMLARAAGFTGGIYEAGAAPARSQAVRWIEANLDRIDRTLGWAPGIDLADSVRACWEG